MVSHSIYLFPVLAAVFPSLRQVRTPLVVGALWLTFWWVVLAPGMGQVFSGSEYNDLTKLANWLGKNVLIASLALLSVFVGSFVTLREWPGGLPVLKEHDGEVFVHPSLIEAVDWAGPEVRDIAATVSWEQLARADWIGRTFSGLIVVFANQHAVLRNIDGHRHQTWRKPDDPAHWRLECISYALALHAMTTERRLLADRLQVAHDGLFQEYDRLRSEAALRYSLILPMIFLFIACGVRFTPWLLVGLPLLVVLAITGRKAEFDARRLLGRALRLGVIKSPSAEILHSEPPEEPAPERSLEEVMASQVKEWMQDAEPQIVIDHNRGPNPGISILTAAAATPEQIVKSTVQQTKQQLQAVIRTYRGHV